MIRRTILLGLFALSVLVPANAENVTFDLTASRWKYNVSPGGAIIVNEGDFVTLRIMAVTSDSQGSGVTHGFRMSPYVGSQRISRGTTTTSEHRHTLDPRPRLMSLP